MTWLPPLWLRWAFTYVPPTDPTPMGVWWCRGCSEKFFTKAEGRDEYANLGCGCDQMSDTYFIKIGTAAPECDLVFIPGTGLSAYCHCRSVPRETES